MAKATAQSTMNTFREGVEAFHRSVAYRDAASWTRSEAEIKRAAKEMADALEGALKIHLRGLVHLGEIPDEDRGKLKHPNFNDLMSLLEKYSDIVIDPEARSSFYDYRDARNDASHNNAIPSFELVRDMVERLPSFMGELLSIEPPIDSRAIGAPVEDLLEEKVIEVPPLVGRDDYLSQARTIIDRSISDNVGAIITVAGESGVGKTHFCRSICAYAIERGARLVSTACEPFQDGIELFPIREILRQISGHSNAAELVRTYYAPSSSQVTMAELAEAKDVDSIHRKDAYLATFANALYGPFASSKDGHRQPLIIFLDDLEWIDSSTVDALLCVRSRFSEGPVVLIGAYRSDIVNEHSLATHPLRPLIESMNRPTLTSLRLHFSGLERSDIKGVIESVLGGDVGIGTRELQRLFEESEGNPLFIREIVYSLMGDGDQACVRQMGDGFRFTKSLDTVPIPESVEEAVKARLSQIDVEQRQDLERAAVIGRNFAYSIISQLSDDNEARIDQSLEYFLKAKIIQEVEQTRDVLFQFSHGKLRDVTYDQIPTFKRRRMHAQVADILEKIAADLPNGKLVGAIGRHHYASGNFGAARSPLLEAASQSKESFALSQAAEQYRTLIECATEVGWPDGWDASEIILSYAEVLELLGRYDEALSVCANLHSEVNDQARRFWVTNSIGDLSWLLGKREDALEAYERSLAIALDLQDDSALLEVYSDLTEFHDREAERLAGIDSSETERHRALSEGYLSQQVEAAERVEDKKLLARSFRNRAKKLRKSGDLTGALESYRKAVQLGDPRVADHSVLVSFAKTLRLSGDLAAAEETLRKVLDWGIQTGARRTEGIAHQHLAMVLLDQDIADLERVKLHVDEANSIFGELGYARGIRESGILMAEYLLLSGLKDNAHKVLLNVMPLPNPEAPLSEVIDVACHQLVAMDEAGRSERLRESLEKLC